MHLTMWKREMTMKSTISLLLILLSTSLVFASDSTSVAYDSTTIDARSFDLEKIDEHKADSDFDYGSHPEAELSIWERIKLWFLNILQKLFYLGTGTPIGKVIIYILVISVLAYSIYRIIKTQTSKPIYANRSDDLPYNLHHEDIHEMDFDALIVKAISNNEFRLAIRLIYLYALKHLSDRELIDWQAGKTNHEYVSELKNENIRKGFNELSYYFDYAWYGDFKVDNQLFSSVNNTFINWKNNLGEKRS